MRKLVKIKVVDSFYANTDPPASILSYITWLEEQVAYVPEADRSSAILIVKEEEVAHHFRKDYKIEYWRDETEKEALNRIRKERSKPKKTCFKRS